MNVIDIVLLVFILLGLVRGFMKGLFVEIASLLALILGVYGAIHFSNYAAGFLETKTDWSEKTIAITAFAITFVAIVFLITLAGKALTKIADFAALGILNKLLGGVFGGLKTALILSVILTIFDKMNRNLPFVDEQTIEDSMLYKPVNELVLKLFPAFSGQDEENQINSTEES